MSSGLSLEDLARLPLTSWDALYRSARALRMEQMVEDISVKHGKPERLRQELLRSARDARRGRDNTVGDDPGKIKRLVSGFPVGVREVKEGETAGDDK